MYTGVVSSLPEKYVATPTYRYSEMAKKITAFGDKGIREIQNLIREEQHRTRNTSGRGRDPSLDAQDWLPPEVYVALTPPEGIDALSIDTDTGTGTELAGTGTGEGNTPGFADCDIYRVIHAGTPPDDTPNLHPVGSLNKRVHNISSTPIGGSTWILVIRDKFGIWFASGSLGGGTGTGRITVEDDSGSPSFHGIHTVQGDTDTGLLVDQPGVGKARFRINRCNSILVVTNVCPIFDTPVGTAPANVIGMEVEWSKINLLDSGCSIIEKWCDTDRVDCCTEPTDTGTGSDTGT